ncbi:hypothetical protein KY284_004013 [Solanum tuberosum]|nr:hypothetical protein KY284_004013 [Solanum tuberosum]
MKGFCRHGGGKQWGRIVLVPFSGAEGKKREWHQSPPVKGGATVNGEKEGEGGVGGGR